MQERGSCSDLLCWSYSSEQESSEGEHRRPPHPAYSWPGPRDADTEPEEEEAKELASGKELYIFTKMENGTVQFVRNSDVQPNQNSSGHFKANISIN